MRKIILTLGLVFLLSSCNDTTYYYKYKIVYQNGDVEYRTTTSYAHSYDLSGCWHVGKPLCGIREITLITKQKR